MFDVVLREKEGADGLTEKEVMQMFRSLSGKHFFPLDLEARSAESSAMGFITTEAADALWYDYEGSGFHDFIASILDDMEKENSAGIYEFRGLNISLCR